MTIDEFMRDIAPKMKQGWIAMDKTGDWSWFSSEPYYECDTNWEIDNGFWCPLFAFNINPVSDWEESLRKVCK